ncbi:3'-5' exonuclease [Nocardia amamiensis]|uniref:3'-5' exonuclease n=1 Tax=Nocardia amamiensis TaxID=404578 RepID=UPI00082C7736|nr:3'-5' exonuclease [Nocardia amamiensis]
MTASVRTHYGPLVLADEVGLARWQFEKADAAGMLPKPGHMRGWLPEQVADIRGLVPQIVERFGAEHPIGSARCADRLTHRIGRPVQHSDIHALAEAGHLEVVDVYQPRGGGEYELFAPAQVDMVTAEEVEAVITAREAWTASSVTEEEACRRLGWDWRELAAVVAERQIQKGRFGRYRREDIDALAAEEELDERIRQDRLVTADAAAELLDVVRRHFDIAVEAGWVKPKTHHDKEVGRYRTVSVPLYRTGDVLALLDLPDVDWEQVRATPKGEKSPLLELVGGRVVSRAKAIRAFLGWFGAEHGIEMWGWWVPGPDVWEIDWERIVGGPTKADVEAAIEQNPVLRKYRYGMQLHSAAGAAIRFARRMLEPGAAVILDTETTDLYGAVCEIAVIDAATGKTLLNTLVNPGPGVPIEPGAFAVHGITDTEVTADGVPDWPTVYKRLLRITKDRIVLAYNAEYDRSVITSDCTRHGIRRTRLAHASHWADVMVPRSDHARSRRWLPNEGGHRALCDVQQTRQHLLRMTAP